MRGMRADIARFPRTNEIMRRLHAVSDDPDQFADAAIGPLESIFHQGYIDDTLWLEVERLTREDPLFRRAMSHVWADFERVNPLLWDAGVWRRPTVSFVVLDGDWRGGLGWRAPSVAGIDAAELPRLLRDIADALEQGRTRLG